MPARHATLVLAASLCAGAAARAQETPRWSLVEAMRIGSVDDPSTSLTLVGQVLVRNGRVYVTQPRESVIRVFDEAGAPVGTIGKSGDGPGEFQQVTYVGWLGDTLYVADAVARRLTFHHPPGVLVGTMPAQTPPFDDWFSPSVPYPLVATGDAVAWPRYRGSALLEEPDFHQPLLRTTWSGEILDTIVLLSMEHSATAIRTGRSQRFGTQPFADDPRYAPSPDGSYVALVDRRVAVDVRSGEYVVTLLPLRGPGPAHVRVPYTPIRIPGDVRDSVRMEMGRGLARRTGLREALVELDGTLFLPESYPPVSRVEIGDDRKIWVRREEVIGATSVRWDVLSPNAIPIAHVETPASLRVLNSRGDIVWASVTDDLDVPYVVRYRLVRSGG